MSFLRVSRTLSVDASTLTSSSFFSRRSIVEYVWLSSDVSIVPFLSIFATSPSAFANASMTISSSSYVVDETVGVRSSYCWLKRSVHNSESSIYYEVLNCWFLFDYHLSQGQV